MRYSSPMKILLIEDDPDDYVIIKTFLANISPGGYALEWVNTYEAALREVGKSRFDVYLLDYRLGANSGLDLLREMIAEGCRSPIILLTGYGDHSVDLEAMRIGAADYLSKRQLSSESLERSIRYAVERGRVVEELETYRNHLEELVEERTAEVRKINFLLEEDIRARKRVEEALRESEERYRRLVELSPETIAVHSEGRYVYVNPAGAKLFGAASPVELIGMPVVDLIHPDHREVVDAIVGENIEEGSTTIFAEHKILRIDGKVIDVEVTRMPVEYLGKRAVQVVIRDVTERKQTEEKIKRLALYDSLTDLPNRHLFFDRLSNAITRAHRYQQIAAVLYIDLDGFKSINDTFGHEIGDSVLVETAKRLKQCIRESDTAARLGGDEFAIILQDFHKKQICEDIALRIVDSLARPLICDGRPYLLGGASIGISIYPSDAQDMDILLQKSDQAMYVAKRSGGGGYVFYDSIDLGPFGTPDSGSLKAPDP